MVRWMKRGVLWFLFTLLLGAGHAHANADVLRDTLPNGLRVVIVRNALAPMVSTRLVFISRGPSKHLLSFPALRMRWNI